MLQLHNPALVNEEPELFENIQQCTEEDPCTVDPQPLLEEEQSSEILHPDNPFVMVNEECISFET
jgi:hypothetical protein